MCANLEVAWAKWSVGCSGVYLQERVQVGASKFSEKASSLIFICYRAHSSTGPGWNKSNLYEQTWKFPEWAGGCCMSDFRLQSSVRVCLNTRDGSLLLCFSGDLPVWLLARCEMVAGRNWTWMCRRRCAACSSLNYHQCTVPMMMFSKTLVHPVYHPG